MRNLEDFKKSFSNILGMEVEEEIAKMIEETVNTAVSDYEEASKLLTDNGSFGEDGSYTVNDSKGDYWKKRYMDAYMGVTEETENVDVTPDDDEGKSDMALDEILGLE